MSVDDLRWSLSEKRRLLVRESARRRGRLLSVRLQRVDRVLQYRWNLWRLVQASESCERDQRALRDRLHRGRPLGRRRPYDESVLSAMSTRVVNLERERCRYLQHLAQLGESAPPTYREYAATASPIFLDRFHLERDDQIAGLDADLVAFDTSSAMARVGDFAGVLHLQLKESSRLGEPCTEADNPIAWRMLQFVHAFRKLGEALNGLKDEVAEAGRRLPGPHIKVKQEELRWLRRQLETLGGG